VVGATSSQGFQSICSSLHYCVRKSSWRRCRDSRRQSYL